MVNKCVVVGCNLNYDSMRKKTKRDSSGNVICNDENDEKRIATFHFPTDNNLKQKWIKFVCRGKDYAPTTNSVICSFHFEEKCLTKGEKRIRLNYSLDPVPTIYPKDYIPQSSILPSSASKQQRKPPKNRRIPDEYNDFVQ